MHNKLVRGHWLIISLVTWLCSCAAAEEDVTTYTLHFVVQVAEGQPLSSAPVYLDRKPIGETDADGSVSVQVSAKNNQTLSAHADCPANYRNSDQPTAIHLRQFRSLASANSDNALRFVFTCVPTKVSAAVIVSTSLSAELPLLMHGHEVGRTNVDGIAHLLIDASPGSNFTLLVDTQDYPEVRPQYPSKTFYVGHQDELYVYEQNLEIPRANRANKRSKQGARHRPIRIH